MYLKLINIFSLSTHIICNYATNSNFNYIDMYYYLLITLFVENILTI